MGTRVRISDKELLQIDKRHWLNRAQNMCMSFYSNDSWSIIQLVYLDKNIKNKPSGPGNIDRHGCAAIDLNADLKEDMVCMVGADEGDGEGFNEAYLTQEDGTLSKLYSTLRAREIYPLRSFSD
eukprot:scaffold200803_cov47-Attheya_sp.AAC.1